jgi:23S rRNA (adenine2030-N6)-methyltransferase
LLSYQHAFHAGNHADVLKHATLCLLIRALSLKEKPFFYLDTHAGSGCYEIEGQSHHDEVAALSLLQTAQIPPEIADYIGVIEPYIAKSNYPGSPLVVWDMLELLVKEKGYAENFFSTTNLLLSELHPSAFDDLKQWTRHTDFRCHHRDGLELLNATTPPKPNRGLILIDPSYEQVSEYEQLVQAMTKALGKWKNGIYCIWYPLLSAQRIDRISGDIVDSPKHGLSENMLNSFTELATKHNVGLLDVQFAHHSPSKDIGMYGSGMVIFNPPWQVDASLKIVVEFLQTTIQSDTNELSHISMLVPSP